MTEDHNEIGNLYHYQTAHPFVKPLSGRLQNFTLG